MNPISKGSVMIVLEDGHRELLLALLDLHRESLEALRRLRPDSNIGPAWDETLEIKRRLEATSGPNERRWLK